MAARTKAKKSAPERRQALIVAGMHRSGTSAMARLLSMVGAALPERVIDPGPDNPLGYWEPWEMVALDDAILEAIGSRWDNVFSVVDDGRAFAIRDQFLAQAKEFLNLNFGDENFLVMKDPRSSILTNFWRQALYEIAVDPVYVIMVRHPLEVAASLKARNGTSRETALMLWTSYMLAVERDTRDAPRVFISYSDMLNDWQGVLDRVEAVMGRPLPNRTPETKTEIEAFLSRSHRHHDADEQVLDQAEGWPGAAKTYAWLQAAAKGDAPSTTTLAQVEAELTGLEQMIGPILLDLRRQLQQIPLAQAEAAQAREAEAISRYRLEEVRAEIETLKGYANRLHAEADSASQMARYQTLRADAEQAKFDILRGRLAQAENDLALLRVHTEQQQSHIEQQQSYARGLETQVLAMTASTSWRITRPLRSVIVRLRRGR